jgi:hypothetical protein
MTCPLSASNARPPRVCATPWDCVGLRSAPAPSAPPDDGATGQTRTSGEKRRGRDSNPRWTGYAHNGFRDLRAAGQPPLRYRSLGPRWRAVGLAVGLAGQHAVDPTCPFEAANGPDPGHVVVRFRRPASRGDQGDEDGRRAPVVDSSVGRTGMQRWLSRARGRAGRPVGPGWSSMSRATRAYPVMQFGTPGGGTSAAVPVATYQSPT